MTIEEAIEYIKKWDIDLSIFDDEQESIKCHEIALKALEEIQQYRAIGTVEECREAAGRQKGKKVKNSNACG